MFEDLLLREVHTAEISALRPRNCAASIGIGDSTFFTTGFGNRVSMLPVVAKLARLPAYDEVRRARIKSLPLSPAHSSQLEECSLQTLMNNLTMALLYLDDAMWTCRIAAIAEIVDDKGPGSRNRLQNFARPLEHEMWRAHADGRVRPCFGMGMGNRVGYGNRHQRFAGSALANDGCRSRGLQMLGDSRDGQSLSRKR